MSDLPGFRGPTATTTPTAAATLPPSHNDLLLPTAAPALASFRRASTRNSKKKSNRAPPYDRGEYGNLDHSRSRNRTHRFGSQTSTTSNEERIIIRHGFSIADRAATLPVQPPRLDPPPLLLPLPPAMFNQIQKCRSHLPDNPHHLPPQMIYLMDSKNCNSENLVEIVTQFHLFNRMWPIAFLRGFTTANILILTPSTHTHQ